MDYLNLDREVTQTDGSFVNPVLPLPDDYDWPQFYKMRGGPSWERALWLTGTEGIDVRYGYNSMGKSSQLFEVWASLLTRGVEPEKLRLARKVQELFGELDLQTADYVQFELTNWQWLVQEYLEERFQSLVTGIRDVRRRLAARLGALVRRQAELPFETGSAAAIAKRINPLGAPPLFI